MNPVLLISLLFLFSTIPAFADSHIEQLMTDGKNAFSNGDFDDAISFFEQVLEIDPNHANAINNIGSSYGSLGERDLSIEYFEKALELDPDNPHALTNKGQSLLYDVKISEAIYYFEKALESDPENNLAQHYLKLSLGQSPNIYYPEGSMEIIIHNKFGNLVAYSIIKDIAIIGDDSYEEWLDLWPVEKIVKHQEHDYQLLKIHKTMTIEHDRVITKFGVILPLVSNYTFQYEIRQYGFPVEVGDTLSLTFNILRPIG